MSACSGRMPHGVDPSEANLPGIGPEEPHDLRDQSCLAGTVVAEQPHDFPGPDAEGDVVVRHDLPEAAGEVGGA